MQNQDSDKFLQLLRSKRWRVSLRILAFIIGVLVSAFTLFNVLFLYRVLPHGGLW